MSKVDTDVHVTIKKRQFYVCSSNNKLLLVAERQSYNNITLHNCNMFGDKFCEQSVFRFSVLSRHQAFTDAILSYHSIQMLFL